MIYSNTILVVQYEDGQRDLTCKSLDDMGYHTIGVSSVKEALSFLSFGTDGIRMVLTDYHLPDSSGYELKIKLQELRGVKPIPVVFLDKSVSKFIKH